MTEKQITEYLGPYQTGPIHIEQHLDYEISGFFNNKCSYSFSYHCETLGISWDSNGNILQSGFSTDVYQLFKKCKLDVDTLKTRQRSMESVPSENKELKAFLSNYEAGSKIIDLMFEDESWRRDYWFCEGCSKLHYKFYLKEESRFIIQWSPGAIMLDLQMDHGDTTRTYEIAEVPGKKGVYNYSNLGFTAIERIRKISDYFSQFGFSFSEKDISNIVKELKNGYVSNGDLIKNKESRSSASKSSDKTSVKPDDYDDLIDLTDDILSIQHTIRSRAIPILASLISIAGDIDIRENNEEISEYAKETINSFKDDGLQTKYCEAFIRKTIEKAYHGFGEGVRDTSIIKSVLIDFIKDNYDSEKYESVFLGYIDFALALTKTINRKMLNELIEIASEFDLIEEEVNQKVIECGYKNFFNNSYDDNEEENDSSQNPNWKPDEFYLGILGLKLGANLEKIKEARNTLVKFFHPDNYAGNEKKKIIAEEHLKKINDACDVLTNRYKERE
jgi:hypothetical protein